jgi:hypothetical protein
MRPVMYIAALIAAFTFIVTIDATVSHLIGTDDDVWKQMKHGDYLHIHDSDRETIKFQIISVQECVEKSNFDVSYLCPAWEVLRMLCHAMACAIDADMKFSVIDISNRDSDGMRCVTEVNLKRVPR